MKIAIVVMNSFFSDGRVERIAKALSSVHEVKIFGLDDGKKKYPIAFGDIPVELLKLKTKKLSKHPFVQIFKYFEYYQKTISKIKQFAPDLIYCNDAYTIYFGRYFKKKGVKFIYDSHELWSDSHQQYGKNGILFKVLAWIESKTIDKTDLVISVSNEILKTLEKKYFLKNTLLIMNIPEFEHFNQKIENTNTNTILYLGVVNPGRGLTNLVRSVSYWRDDLKLKIIGDGIIRTKLMKLVNDLDLEERVSLPGAVPQSEVLAEFRNCSAGITAIENTCLNHYYSLPNKFFQITLSGKAILASDFPEMKKLIDRYNLGYTFDPANIKAIADAVNTLAENNFKLDDVRYEKFIQEFSWANEEKKILAEISEVMNND